MARERTARRREENEVESSRIVAFSDGVFAIAITLLVLNLQRQDLLAYAISFAVIGRFFIDPVGRRVRRRRDA